MNASAPPLLELRGIAKSFGAVQALAEVDLAVRRGEVVALVGDNGAGKSTLIKTVAGVTTPDAGNIVFEGRRVNIRSPHSASSLGIAVVYQDLALCDNLDVVANLFLGRELRRGPLRLLDEIAMEKRALDLLAGLRITMPDIRMPVGSLSGGQRQVIAIARALLGDPTLVILDEPTAALGVTQTAGVLELIGHMRDRGIGVVFVSHNFVDVFRVADRVVVLRLGSNAGEFVATPENRQPVLAAITGMSAADEVAIGVKR